MLERLPNYKYEEKKFPNHFIMIEIKKKRNKLCLNSKEFAYLDSIFAHFRLTVSV